MINIERAKRMSANIGQLAVCGCGQVFDWKKHLDGHGGCPDCGCEEWISLTNEHGMLIDIEDLYNVMTA